MYFPFLSKATEAASLRPSVTWCAVFPSSPYTNTARIVLSNCRVYASHLPSGDHAGSNPDPGPPSYGFVSTRTGFPPSFSTSTYHRFSRLSLYAIFLLFGDHFGE